jgi:hypothetical protein
VRVVTTRRSSGDGCAVDVMECVVVLQSKWSDAPEIAEDRREDRDVRDKPVSQSMIHGDNELQCRIHGG